MPAWAQRAKQASGSDVTTAALVAAALKCPAVPLAHASTQQLHPLPGPPPAPAWLALQVAQCLPEASQCSSACQLLQLGAAVAAACGTDLGTWRNDG